jgi:hypothetical protein
MLIWNCCTYKNKAGVTRTPLKTGGELRCTGRVSSSCSTSDTRRVNLVTNPRCGNLEIFPPDDSHCILDESPSETRRSRSRPPNGGRHKGSQGKQCFYPVIRVSSSCSTSDTRRVNLVTNPPLHRKENTTVPY